MFTVEALLLNRLHYLMGFTFTMIWVLLEEKVICYVNMTTLYSGLEIKKCQAAKWKVDRGMDAAANDASKSGHMCAYINICTGVNTHISTSHTFIPQKLSVQLMGYMVFT